MCRDDLTRAGETDPAEIAFLLAFPADSPRSLAAVRQLLREWGRAVTADQAKETER